MARPHGLRAVVVAARRLRRDERGQDSSRQQGNAALDRGRTDTVHHLLGTRAHHATWGDLDFTIRLRTLAQRRRGQPNPWEVGWLLWRYTDNDHFYSFIVKPNGFELGKQDPAYPGRQRFLAYAYAPAFPAVVRGAGATSETG